MVDTARPPWATGDLRSVSDAESPESRHHGAPIGKSRLGQIEPHEGGEEIEAWMDQITQDQRRHDETPRNEAEIAIHIH